MKKTIIFIVLLASIGGCLQAQDTVWQRVAPLGNYYFNNWIDTTQRYSVTWSADAARVIAKQVVTKDTLQIYGIASLMVFGEGFIYKNFNSVYYPTIQDLLNARFPEDPSFENCEESLLLYQYRGSGSPVMQQLGDSLRVHYLYTPVSHWMMTNNTPMSAFDTIPKPIYERYFQTPQTVFDTFYVGYTQNDFEIVEEAYEEDDVWDTVTVARRVRPGLQTFMFTSSSSMDNGYDEHLALLWPSIDVEDSTLTWDFSRSDPYFTLYLFPILTPAPPVDTTVTPTDTTVTPTDTTVTPIDTTVTPIDTTVTPIDTVTPGGDTLRVQTADLVSRYVNVMPNPAHERAEVLSSFGLTKIELYDEQGRRLRTLPAAGLRATLDLHSLGLARASTGGTLILRIHTPAGTTTKKLLVR